ncbi:MAG: DUF6316 family protein [Pseudomonadota bacterium]|uniref:DUF6316 family protein n=1 Tax=Alcanivorax sp. TaxID=1872427 RepID=UPI00243E598B|nr:DUF6316 family protein [Alcanivorax sp.]MED5239316.1 DUF6316 family protein [Pseudomonadota bacterium]MEE3321967.1 DUF6316 family protein [Pseudomonadota bacterium]
MECRGNDDVSRTWFRSDRFFNEGPDWYFSTRENTVEGPFASRTEAETGLMLYLRDMQAMESYGLQPARMPD